ncbi:MAG: 1-acyl-sn-glycerol-3-phosphate acyltransferase [Acidobacteria bacterium]|nr:1-acyl-sn-glycerol-3-phosphate acyltransferase [Acidobacteriota bacterium]
MRVVSFLFSLWVWPVAVVLTILFSVAAVAATPFSPTGRTTLYLARWWGRLILLAAAVRLRVEGLQNLDPSRFYVIMANHESILDIPALLAALPSRIGTRFLAKESLFSVPLLGWALKALGFIPVDRANRSTAVGMFLQAIDQARGGNSLLIFPEETRTDDGRLLPFRRGGFLLAMRSHFPILPVGLEGPRLAMPSHDWKVRPLSVITVRIGEAIPTEGRSMKDRQALMDETRCIIDRLRGPRGHIPEPEGECSPRS